MDYRQARNHLPPLNEGDTIAKGAADERGYTQIKQQVFICVHQRLSAGSVLWFGNFEPIDRAVEGVGLKAEFGKDGRFAAALQLRAIGRQARIGFIA